MKHAAIVRHREYEHKIRREARALREAGYAVDVICLREPGHGLVGSQDGVRVIRVPLGRERGGALRYVLDYVAFFVVAFVLLTVLDLKHRFDLVQLNTMPDFLVFAAVVPKFRGAKVAVFMHEPCPELAEITMPSPFVRRALVASEQAALRFADVALTVTQQLKDRFVERGADPSKITVVLNGPDPDLLRCTDSVVRDANHFTVVCHGSIEERYGHDDLLEAARIARSDIPELRVYITGSGSHADHIAARIVEMGLSDTVRYLGLVAFDDLVRLLCRADLGVVPMRDTAYSNLVHTNKMFDCMIVGTPVAATRLDAVTAYFDESVLAFAEPDDPKSLARTIVGLARDPARREEMVLRAHERYTTYGWPAQKRIYLEAVA